MTALKVSVDFYDEAQKELIRTNYPSDYEVLCRYLPGEHELSLEDFMAYSLFRHQIEASGYSTFRDFASRAENAWTEYEMYYQYEGIDGNLYCKYPGPVEALNVPESLGVAGSLSVLSHIYELHQADWKRIPRKTVKDLDFTHNSSIAGRTINVESKGSIADDNLLKSSSVSTLKNSIIGKKVAGKMRSSYAKSDTLLGSITVAGRKNQPLRCWILDPPTDKVTFDPDKHSILKRLYYYGDLLSFIAPRSQLSIALANRISVLEEMSDLAALDGVPLVGGTGKKIEITETFATTKSYIKNRSSRGYTRLDWIFGRCQMSYEKTLWFFGLPLSVAEMLVSQNFERILAYNKPQETSRSSLKASLINTQFGSLPETIRQQVTKSMFRRRDQPANYTRFEIRGISSISASGLTFMRIR